MTRDNIEKIIYGAAERIKINIEQNAVGMIARYAKNGRDAVKILQMAKNIIFLDDRRNVTFGRYCVDFKKRVIIQTDI